MLNKGGSDIWRKVRIYMIGFIIGLVAVYFMFGGRTYQVLTPGLLKLDQLAAQKFKYSDTATCQMKCEKISEDELKDAMTNSKVDSKKSKDFNQRYPLFNFNGKTRDKRGLNVICQERDSITVILSVRDTLMKDTCKCH